MGEPHVIRVTVRSVRVEVRAVPGAELSVEGGHVRRHDDGSYDITADRSHVSIVCAAGSSVTISTASGPVETEGPLGSVHVVTASGRVEVARADELEVRTVSARVEVGDCRGACRVTSKSGRIEVGTAGSVDLASTSGNVTVGRADLASVRTVSSRIEIGASAAARVSAHSISGRVEVRLLGTSPARLDLRSVSGGIERRVPEGEGGAHVEASSTSGAVVVEHG
ncbi:MAG: DUF4097 family beta strand repeat protein [Actinobacteria bacterium]|nr:DUF4097 family beta strand repeat protein [Actinomycetota bacterium]